MIYDTSLGLYIFLTKKLNIDLYSFLFQVIFQLIDGVEMFHVKIHK